MLHAPLDTLAFSLFFFTYCLIQCFVHSLTHCCFPCFIHIVLCSVTYTFGHTGVFPVLYILFDAMLHGQLDTLAFSVFFYTLFDACFVHRSTNWCFPYLCTYCLMHRYTLFDAVFHAPFDTLVFFLFLYMRFDRLFDAHLDTLVFSLFYTYCFNPYFFAYCLILCYMHSWTHLFFPVLYILF